MTKGRECVVVCGGGGGGWGVGEGMETVVARAGTIWGGKREDRG